MKLLNKKNLLIITLTVVLIGTGLIVANLIPSQAQSSEEELGGWIWTENYGWFSLNSSNINPDCDTDPSCIDYAVVKGASGNLTGYAWSENVGWMCFGSTCGAYRYTSPVVKHSVSARLVDNQLSGWARILSLDAPGQAWLHGGWVELRDAYASQSVPEAAMCYGCHDVCYAYAQICDENNPPVCVDDLDNCLNMGRECGTCFETTLYDGVAQPDDAGLDPSDVTLGGSGYICSNCTDCEEIPDLIGSGSRTKCNNCPSCKEFGVNNEDKFYGWAWNGMKDSQGNPVIGAGWIKFHTSVSNSYIAYPWLETKYGSIYAGGSVEQRGAVGRPSATYCIFADNLVNVSSGDCSQESIDQVQVGNLGQGTFTNALGKLDVEGLSTVYSHRGDDDYNKYGQKVTTHTGFPTYLDDPEGLDNRVMVVNGNLSVGDLTINIGENYGNGLVIVKGNLYITGDIKYAEGGISDLKQLPSIAWVVLGDIIVNNDVQEIAGAFIALGRSDVAGCSLSGDLYQLNNCGVFDDANNDTLSKNQSLTVRGLIAASAYNFQRTFSSIGQGSERIIYDGRLIANPPPGLKGFAEGLPVVRDF